MTFDWVTIFGGVLVVGTVGVFAWMAYSRRSQFNFSEMFLGDDGRTSMGKFLAYIGGLGATWIVVRQTDDGTLSDLTFGAYIGTLVAGKVASEFVAARKSVDRIRATNGSSAPPDESQPAGQVDITVPLSVKQSDVSVTAAKGTRMPLGKRR